MRAGRLGLLLALAVVMFAGSAQANISTQGIVDAFTQVDNGNAFLQSGYRVHTSGGWDATWPNLQVPTSGLYYFGLRWFDWGWGHGRISYSLNGVTAFDTETQDSNSLGFTYAPVTAVGNYLSTTTAHRYAYTAIPIQAGRDNVVRALQSGGLVFQYVLYTFAEGTLLDDPVADASGTAAVSDGDGTVELDGSASTSDPGATITDWDWYDGLTLLGSGETLAGASVPFGGSRTFTLVVTDSYNFTASDDVTVDSHAKAILDQLLADSHAEIHTHIEDDITDLAHLALAHAHPHDHAALYSELGHEHLWATVGHIHKYLSGYGVGHNNSIALTGGTLGESDIEPVSPRDL